MFSIGVPPFQNQKTVRADYFEKKTHEKIDSLRAFTHLHYFQLKTLGIMFLGYFSKYFTRNVSLPRISKTKPVQVTHYLTAVKGR